MTERHLHTNSQILIFSRSYLLLYEFVDVNNEKDKIEYVYIQYIGNWLIANHQIQVLPYHIWKKQSK